MEKLFLEKENTLNLKKRPQSMYDKLNEDYKSQLKTIKKEHHEFVDNVIIPQIKLFNSIGFYAKGFHYNYVESSIKSFEFDILSDYLEDLGLKCILKELYDISQFYIYIDWRDSVINTSKQVNSKTLTTLTSYLKNHYSDFNNIIYDKLEKFAHEYIFPKMLENNTGSRTLKVNLPRNYSSIFHMITLLEILKKNDIYAEPELLNLNSLNLDWSKPYTEFSKNIDFDVYDAKFFIECFEGKMNHHRISHITILTAIDFDKDSHRGVMFYDAMLNTVEVPVDKKVTINTNASKQSVNSGNVNLDLYNEKATNKDLCKKPKENPMLNPVKRVGFIISCTLFIQCDNLIF